MCIVGSSIHWFHAWSKWTVAGQQKMYRVENNTEHETGKSIIQQRECQRCGKQQFCRENV